MNEQANTFEWVNKFITNQKKIEYFKTIHEWIIE